jgi:hypothetical protein
MLKVETNFPDMRLSPIVPVSNRAFALCPFTVMYASRVLASALGGPAWFDVTVVAGACAQSLGSSLVWYVHRLLNLLIPPGPPLPL